MSVTGSSNIVAMPTVQFEIHKQATLQNLGVIQVVLKRPV